MQKQTIKRKHKYQRSHQVRISSVALALATAFHISGMSHMDKQIKVVTTTNIAKIFANHMERENETARHIVRYDEGLRLPTTGSGL